VLLQISYLPRKGMSDHQHCFTYRRCDATANSNPNGRTKRKRDITGAVTPPRRRRTNSGRVNVHKEPSQVTSTQEFSDDHNEDSFSDRDSGTEYEFNSESEVEEEITEAGLTD